MLGTEVEGHEVFDTGAARQEPGEGVELGDLGLGDLGELGLFDEGVDLTLW